LKPVGEQVDNVFVQGEMCRQGFRSRQKLVDPNLALWTERDDIIQLAVGDRRICLCIQQATISKDEKHGDYLKPVWKIYVEFCMTNAFRLLSVPNACCIRLSSALS
jgi:hypothetical protein